MKNARLRIPALVSPLGVAMVFASLGAIAQTAPASAPKAEPAKPAAAVANPAAPVKPAAAVANPAAPAQSAEAAKTAGKPAEMEDQAEAFDYAVLTPGFWTGENYFEGRADALIPLFQCPERNGMLFFNGRGAWADEGEEEMNLGLVMRKRCLPGDGVFGLNTYYDSRWTKQDMHYNQWGAGAEVLTTWLDARANYYLPEHKEDLLGSEESVSVVSSKTVTRYDQYAVGDQLREKWKRYRYETLQHDRYDYYAYPMKGYDAEIGALLPLGIEDIEARLFVGYYDFEERSGKNRDYDNDEISGIKGRFEVRGWDRLILDAEIYEDDDLYDSKYLVSARIRIPIGGDGVKTDGLLDDRLNEMVLRDPHVQVKSGSVFSQSLTNEKKLVGKGDELLLDDVIFVHADRGGGPSEDGSAERPFDLIQEGVDKSEAIHYPNVYVFGAHNRYRENIVIGSAVNLYGEGHKFGHGYPGLGTPPVVTGNPAWAGPPGLFNVFARDPVLISGFHFAGSRTTSLGIPSGGGLPLNVGVFADSPGALTVQRSRFTDLPAGVVMNFDSPLESSALIQQNAFDNVGAGVLGIAFSEASLLVRDNTIDNTLLGVGAVGIGIDANLLAIVSGNRISGASTDIGRYLDPEILIGLHGGEAGFAEFGMSVPGEWPIPSIAGMAFGAYDGAQVFAGALDNTVRGPLVGIIGLSLYGDSSQDSLLRTAIIGNQFAGGGFDPIYGLLRNHAGTLVAGLVDMLGGPDLTDEQIVLIGTMARESLPESLGTDFGLAGVLLGAVGDDAELVPVMAQNRVQDYILGLGFFAADEGRVSDALIAENVFEDNLIGILGIAAMDGVIRRTDIVGNTIRVGGTDKLNTIFDSVGIGGGFEVPNGGLLGIGLVSIDGSEFRRTTIANNAISGAAVGVLGTAIHSDMDDTRIVGNTLRDNLIGVAGLAYGDNADIRDFVVRGNTIVGGGTAELIGILDAVLSGTLGVDLSLADLGIVGIGLFSLEGAEFDDFLIAENRIASQVIGIGLMSYSSDDFDFSCLDYGTIRNNTISDVWAGIMGYTENGHLYEFDIADNTISAGTDDIVGGILANQVGPLFGYDFTDFPGIAGIGLFAGENGGYEYTTIRRNRVDGFIWGIVANASGEESTLAGLTIKNNVLNDNGVGVQVGGQNGANLADVLIKNNTVNGSAFGIIAAAYDNGAPSATRTFMSVDIVDNIIAGNGNRMGQGYYGIEVMSELFSSDDALDPQQMWYWDGFADMPNDIGVVMPPELVAGGYASSIPEGYIDWESQTADGFAGVLVSYNGLTEGGSAKVNDNTISGYRNGMFAAVQDIDDADPIALKFKYNTSVHNILVGNNADYTLNTAGGSQDPFLNLFY